MGGNSINVSWTDGPSELSITKIINKFAGAQFDPLIDLKSYKGATKYNDEFVRFGVDYISSRREYIDDVLINSQIGAPKIMG